MAVYALGDRVPVVEEATYIADEAAVIGDVELGRDATVWPAAVLRGDNEAILIGVRSNVQDGAVVHTDPGHGVTIGAEVSIGHGAVLHGCRIGDRSLVGIRAVIMNGSSIGEESIVAAGALVTENKSFPPRSLIMGSPAKVVRQLGDEEVARVVLNAQDYVSRGMRYARDLGPRSQPRDGWPTDPKGWLVS